MDLYSDFSYVYNYIHEILERMVYSTASSRENSAVCSVFLHHHNIFNTKQNMVLSNNSCSFKFYFKKIKLNNISIYKRQFFLFFFLFFYKISLKIYCHLVLMRAPFPVTL